nr:hypothetical protein [Tanacetum cinerariifolium]
MRRQGKDFSGRVTPLFETMLIQHPAEVGEDETAHEERGDKVERATTTASSLEAEHDNGTISRTQSMVIPNEHIPQGTSSGGRPRRQDTILGDTPAQTRVLALKNNKTAQALEIQMLKKRVKSLEKKRKSRTPQLKMSINLTAVEPVTTVSAPVTTAGVSVSTAEPSTPPTTITTLIKDEDLIIAQTLMKMRSVKSKEKSKEKELDAQMQVEFEEEERVARQAEEEANLISWDNTQAMIEADYELAQRLQVEEQGELTIKERSKLFINTFVPMDSKVLEGSGKKSESNGKEAVSKKRTVEEFDQESSKRQKTSESSELAKEADELSQEELQQMMIIILMQGMNVEALQTKYPIIDWEIYTEGTRKYWKIIRVRNHTKVHHFFDDILKAFDKDDLVMMWSLVKEKFNSIEPIDDNKREIWVEVHYVSTEKGIDIYMLVEKEYPSSRGTLTLMLIAKLLLDHDNKMSKELLRKIFMKAERPRR